jgi:phage terminase large subunit-like protein
VSAFIEEAASFPNGTYDDQIDAASQAIQRLSARGPRLRVLG